jgi:hypothetical protein
MGAAIGRYASTEFVRRGSCPEFINYGPVPPLGGGAKTWKTARIG